MDDLKDLMNNRELMLLLQEKVNQFKITSLWGSDPCEDLLRVVISEIAFSKYIPKLIESPDFPSEIIQYLKDVDFTT